MTTSVFLAVVFAACLHAAWNSLIKGSADKHTAMLGVVLGHVPICIVMILLAPPFNIDALPWMIAGIFLHLGYQQFLITAYRLADLTLVYPIARGSAPLIVTVVSVAVLGLSFTVFEVSGVLLITFGVVFLAFAKRIDGTRDLRGVVLALGTGGFIAAYSLVDGIGARVAGSPLGFWSWAALGNAVLFTCWTALVRPKTFAGLRSDRSAMVMGLGGGTASFLAYGLVIWAFTQAPIALVTALRETSIVFALLIGTIILKERVTRVKIISAGVIIAGAAVLRISIS